VHTGNKTNTLFDIGINRSHYGLRQLQNASSKTGHFILEKSDMSIWNLYAEFVTDGL